MLAMRAMRVVCSDSVTDTAAVAVAVAVAVADSAAVAEAVAAAAAAAEAVAVADSATLRLGWETFVVSDSLCERCFIGCFGQPGRFERR